MTTSSPLMKNTLKLFSPLRQGRISMESLLSLVTNMERGFSGISAECFLGFSTFARNIRYSSGCFSSHISLATTELISIRLSVPAFLKKTQRHQLTSGPPGQKLRLPCKKVQARCQCRRTYCQSCDLFRLCLSAGIQKNLRSCVPGGFLCMCVLPYHCN